MLWLGNSLSKMEQLCIKSAVIQGIKPRVFVYEKPQNSELLNEYVTWADAKDILPEQKIYATASSLGRHPTYATFSNTFRYKFLYGHGGWWSDMDNVFVQPLNIPRKIIMPGERMHGNIRPMSNIMIFPAKDPYIARCLEKAQDQENVGLNLNYPNLGPRLMHEVLLESYPEYSEYMLHSHIFNPIPWSAVRSLRESLGNFRLPKSTITVHLYQEEWMQKGIDKNGQFPQDSPYETLKRQFGVK